jgi:hypothetical protein
MNLLNNPSPIEAKNFLEEAYKNKLLIVMIGNCAVDYKGRAGSYLDEGERLIVIKSDRSVLVHRSSGYKPVNWQPSKTKISFRVEDDYLIIKSIRSRPHETLTIYLNNIKTIIADKLKDTGEFIMYLTEDEMQRILYSNPGLIEEGLRSVIREKELKSGKVDIFCIDKNENPVMVEVKRNKVGEKEILQLYRYVSEYRVTNPDVRGIIVAPSIDPSAQRLLSDLKLKFKHIDLAKLSKLSRRNKKTLLDY